MAKTNKSSKSDKRSRRRIINRATKTNSSRLSRKLQNSEQNQSTTTESRSHKSNDSFPVVGVGASAGGLEAFTRLLKHLPSDTGMGFVLVQHLDPIHKSALTNLLSKATSMSVREVTNNAHVEPDHVYVIPPNTSLTIANGVLKLLPRKKTDGQHRPIDYFYQSLAEDQGSRAISVILSGTASDGTLGCEAVKAEGGITFAQDESAKYDSMPRSAIAAGCIDFVLSPEEIAKELTRIARHPYVHSDIAHEAIGTKDVEEGARELTERPSRKMPGAKEDPYRKILMLLRNKTGVDFSLYKPNTIRRRIGRRMVLSKLKSLNVYFNHLKKDPKEVEALYQDMLISVTGFFRNPEAFDVLKKKVFPKLLKDRSADDAIRIWVLGCSTGQEAYSIAMSFLECTAKANSNVPLQVFATDLNEVSLDKARAGLYTKTLVSDLSPERLRRFFVEEDGGYRISKPIREMCVFAKQNVLTDPPFSRMDLISCRNLLIYLEPRLHKKTLPTFHYALKPNGFLLLGASETVGTNTDLFEPIDKKQRVYSKKPAVTRPLDLAFPGPFPIQEKVRPTKQLLALPEGTELEAQKEADRITISKYGPAGVLINADLEVLQFRGTTSPYLAPASGRASFNLLKMAREGLLLPLRTAINKAKKEKQKVRKENIRIEQNGNTTTANIEVVPLKNVKGQCYLVLFESAERPRASLREGPTDNKSAKSRRHSTAKAPSQAVEAQTREILDLKRNLGEMSDYLQSVLEEHEAANEELQASNEEVQSANEELQSINEELETSKEELESANEELITVNEEMQNRNRELNRANSDLSNLHNSINISVVLLARDLTIRRFNPRAEKELNLLANDIGQPIRRIKTNLDHTDLEAIALDVIKTAKTYEAEARDKTGRWYSLRVSPYFTLDNKIDGAVVILVDVDALKRAEKTSSHFAALVQSSDDAIISKSLEGIILTWNEGAQRMFGYTSEEVVGEPIHILLPPDRVQEEEQMILEKIRRGEPIDRLETIRVAKDGRLIETSLTVSPIRSKDGRITAASTIAHDISERKQVERELAVTLASEQAARAEAQSANRVKDEFLAIVSHELRTPLTAITGWAQMLEKGALDEVTFKRAISSIVRNAANQATIISDLLDTSRIISGKLHLNRQPVNMKEIINDAIEFVRPAIDVKKIDLILDLKPEIKLVDGDPIRLEQALANVLSNAAKFTPDEGRIEMRVWQKDGQIVIAIKDSGIGISPNFLPYIFEKFRQAETSEKRIQGGLGLGLALARQLVEMHGGSIKAESDGLNKGSTFTIALPTIPAMKSEETRGVTTLESTPEEVQLAELSRDILKGLKVMVIDDERDTRDLVNLALTQYGAEVNVCSSANEAIGKVSKWKPAVIVSDIGMPGEDGYDLMQRIRALKPEKGGQTPAIALTGFAAASDEAKALTTGFNVHMAKPVILEHLTRMVAKLSGRL